MSLEGPESISIKRVSFEHHPDGFGVDSSTPRISWSFESHADGVKGWTQRAYDLQILREGKPEPECFAKQGSDCVLVPWPTSPLKSRERVKVRVRAHGKQTYVANPEGKISTDWSAWHSLETALLNPSSDWTASPICSGQDADPDSPLRPIRFRKRFSLPSGKGKVSRARLYITSFGVYEAFLNGRRVSDHHMAPGWTSYNHRLSYQVLDVTDMLNDPHGENLISAEVAEGWYAGRLGWVGQRRHIWGSKLAIMAQLEVHFDGDNGDLFVLKSDESWKWHESALTQSEIYDGETYDLTQETRGWESKGLFDDSQWPAAETLAFPTAKLVAPEAPPVRVVQEIKPVSFFKSKSGKTVVDFGQNLVGRVHIRSIRGSKGDKLVFTHAEVMENGEVATRPLRTAKCIDTIILGDEDLTDYSARFTFHGFRYVQIDGFSLDEDVNPFKKEDIVALVLHTDMRRTGTFSCSHALINKLHLNSCWSMRGNFLSIPTDCPQRNERLGWTGDIAIFGPTANFLYDTRGILGSWLQDVRDEQLEPDGKSIPPVVVPNVLTGPLARMSQAIWADVTILGPWQLYQASGDIEILRRQYASMKAWIAEGVQRGPDGLWDPEAWQLGDWLDPAAPPENPGDSKTDGTYVADAYLVNSTGLIAKVGALLGETADAREFENEYAKVKKLFQDKYITPLGRIVCDTQTGLALAITFSLFSKPEQMAAAAERLAFLVRRSKFRIATGFAGTPAMLPALSKVGEHQLAYRMLQEKNCPSWMYPIGLGATTIWERWDSMLPDGSINPGEMTSFNHYALGSVSAWLHAQIGGISNIDPGWRTVQIAPMPGGTVTRADVSYDGPYGLISCSWKLASSGEYQMTVQVPPNSEAFVILPSERLKTTDDAKEPPGKWVGSGTHDFSCDFNPSEWPPKISVPPFMPAPPDEIA